MSDLQVRLVPRRPTRHGSRQFYAHVFIVVMTLLVAIVLGNAAYFALAGPSLGLLAVAAVTNRAGALDLEMSFDRQRGIEGDMTTLTTRARSNQTAVNADIAVEFPPALEAQGPNRHLTWIRPRQHAELSIPVEMTTWGISSPDTLIVRTSDGAGLLSRRQDYGCEARLRTHLPDPKSRSILDPAHFLRIVGNHTSSRAGDGCELADVRPYRPGDRLRNLNWRISARFDEPWITERHPDRATSVVIVVNAHEDVGLGRQRAMRRSVRFAMALAQSHLRVNDEVGLAVLGQKNRWIAPRSGRLQLERITEALLEINSDATRGQMVPLDTVIPTDAIVVIVSAQQTDPILDQARTLMAKGNLVQLVDPEVGTLAADHWSSPESRPLREWLYRREFIADDGRDRPVAARIFAIDRERRRRRLRAWGFSIVHWRLDQPVESVILALRTSQRSRATATGKIIPADEDPYAALAPELTP